MTGRKKTNREIVDELIERAKADPNCGRVTQEHLEKSKTLLESLGSGAYLTQTQQDRFRFFADMPVQSAPVEKDPNFMPDPRACPRCKERGDDIERMARAIIDKGYRFEIEMLQTGQISMTVSDPEKGEDVACELCDNGPEVLVTVDRLVSEMYARIA